MDVYEELPFDEPEELYEDLPETAYSGQDYPNPTPYNGGRGGGYAGAQNQGSGAPPLPPTSAIPQFRPGQPPPPPPPTTAPPPSAPPPFAPAPKMPPLPTRSANTQLTGKGKIAPKRSSGKNKGPNTKSPSRSGGGGGGGAVGLDMNEILKKAHKNRGERSFADLEKKTNQDNDDPDKYAAPWASQLKKTPKHTPTNNTTANPSGGGGDGGRDNTVNSETPEFVRKARTLSVVEPDVEEDDIAATETSHHPPPPKKPVPSVKPRVPNPSEALPKPASESDVDKDKPAWLKQRERQVSLSQGKGTAPKPQGVGTGPKPSRPPPSPKPGSSESKPSPPLAQKPAVTGKPPIPGKVSPGTAHRKAPPPPAKTTPPLPVRTTPEISTANEHPSSNDSSSSSNNQRPLPVARKPKPSVTPRQTPLSPSHPSLCEDKLVSDLNRLNKPTKQMSPPLTPNSIRERARTLQRTMAGTSSPPPSPSPPLSAKAQAPSPSPPPVKSPPPTNTPPLKPMVRSSSNQKVQTLQTGAKPLAPPPPGKLATKFSPPPIPTRLSSDASSSKLPPPPPPPETPPPPSFTPPAIPGKAPPSFIPSATQGETTPPTGLVMRFRRLPLCPVDVFHPPPMPSRASKPQLPQFNENTVPAVPIMEDEDEEIYDDTVMAADLPPQVLPQEEELYDDVAFTISSAPDNAPPFSAPRQLPPSPSELPPPIPTLPPPNKRPSASEVSVPNGFVIVDDEETYDDVAYTPSSTIPPSMSSNSLVLPPTSHSSSSSLAPPLSPQHGGSSSSSASPTLNRKQKLTKDEKKRLREQEKLEKELKRKNENKMKNRVKGLKAHKQFNLPNDVQPLFAVEVLLPHSVKTKDHMVVDMGELLFVLLIAHDKMASDRYLVEKEDGTIGYVKKTITQRINYNSINNPNPQSALSQAPPPIPVGGGGGAYPEPEDIYESLPQDEEDLGGGFIPPSLPPPNPSSGGGGGGPQGGPRFPPPMQAPPPPPCDGPEETYEYLPEE